MNEIIAGDNDKWPERVLLFEEVMQRLAQFDARAAQIVELKVFVGATDEQVAEVIGKSIRTVKRDYKAAKAWLRAELRGPAPMRGASGGA